MKAVWIGGVFSEYALEKYRAVNQAQNRWSVGLIESLSDLGWSFHSLAFRAEQLWPKGVLRPGKDEDFHPAVKPLLVRTWNIPFIRERSLPRAYLRKLKQHISKEGKPDIVISYNPLSWHVAPAEYAVKELNIPWISITLDLKYPGKNMEHFCVLNQEASGQVILSWWGFENCPLEPKLHLDGGYDQLHPNDADYSENTKKIILYSGKYTDYGGNDLLVDTITACKRSDVEFWLLGKGENARIDALSREDSRVRRMGFVNNAELDQCCRKAHVFLNPRPNAFADNLMTYPSKLLFYMSFGKPIISTWTPGLSPEYRPYFTIPTEETGASFTNAIDSVLDYDSQSIDILRSRIWNYLESSKSWKQQAHRLNDFIFNIINDHA